MTSAKEPIRVLVVDDEEPARQRLLALLRTEPDLTIVRECTDGVEAVEAMAASPVDLVFLDIQMPRLDGFGVLAAVGAERMPPVIFTSAYSEFAVRAFEAYAVDYLLKPFDSARFAGALERGRQQVALRRATKTSDEDARLTGLLQHVGRDEPSHYPEAIAIRTGSKYVVVRVAEIDWIEADGNYSKLYVERRPRLLTKSLGALEKGVLDPEVFVRVHRSAIVNVRRIAAVEPEVHGDLTLLLNDGSRVQCSRRFRKRLEEKLHFMT